MSAPTERERGSGLGAAAMACGLAGVICGVSTLAWTAFTPMDLGAAPTEPRAGLVLFLIYSLLTLTALSCGVMGIVFGAMAGSRNKKRGLKPAVSGRLGLILGIIAVAMPPLTLAFRMVQLLFFIGDRVRSGGRRRFALLLALASCCSG